MRGILYARVSTDEQAETGKSLEVQAYEIREYARDNGIDIIAEYSDEGISAYKVKFFNRPNGKDIMYLIANKQADCIITTHADRLFRNVEDSLVTREVCRKSKVKILHVREDEAGEKPEDKLLLIIKDGIAQYTSDLNALKVKATMEKKARDGENIGKPAYGYKMGPDKKLVIDDFESDIVRTIYQLYLRGNGVFKITDYLNLNKIGEKMWSKTTVYEILRNPNLQGHTVYNRRAPKMSGKRMNAKEEWLITKNTHPAIVSEESFQQVQDIMDKRGRNIRNRDYDVHTASNALLSGLIKCETCGCYYTITSTLSGRKDPQRKKYYKCQGKQRYGKSICCAQNIPMERLDAFILENVSGAITQEQYQNAFSEQLEIAKSKFAMQDLEKKSLQNEIKTLEKDKDKLFKRLLETDQESLKHEYDKYIDSIAKKIRKHQEKLNEYKDFNYEEILSAFDFNFDDFDKESLKQLTKSQIKKIFNELIEKITVQQFTTTNNRYAAFTVTFKINHKARYMLDSVKRQYLKGELISEDAIQNAKKKIKVAS